MLGLSPAAMTKRLDSLERSGHIRRHHDKDDRRRVVVTLTQSGHRIWEDTIDAQDQVERGVLSALDPAQQDQLADLLRSLVRTAERIDPSPLYPWRS
jgi:DNA-binding MarR family transcriptional regulator